LSAVRRAARVTGVRCAGGLDLEDLRLLTRARAVLDPASDDEELAFAKLDVAIASLDCQSSP
jgi:hypothetical protein